MDAAGTPNVIVVMNTTSGTDPSHSGKSLFSCAQKMTKPTASLLDSRDKCPTDAFATDSKASNGMHGHDAFMGNNVNIQRLTESVHPLEDQVKALTRIVLHQCKSLDELMACLNQWLNSVPSDPNAKAVPNHGSKQCGSFDPKVKNNYYKSPKLSKRTPCSVEDNPDYRPTMHTSFTTDHLTFRRSKRRKGSSKKTSKPIAKTGQTDL